MKTAVALRYPEDADAPFIAASARGVLADRIVRIAEDNDIPVVRDEVLTNVLSVQQVGESIPEETWQTVAKIFAFIIGTEEKVNEKLH